MPVTLDLTVLVSELRGANETLVDQTARSEVSPYLLDVLLPMLERDEEPLLREIDFAQFDMYDPPALLAYLDERSQRRYRMEQFNSSLCTLPPKCVKGRAFI